jgi:hypothetical protein
MAKACPKCQRPNADPAAKCIYCGALFPAVPAPPALGARLTPAVHPISKKPEPPESFLVIQSPSPELEPKSLKAYCQLTGFDRYLAKQRFKSPAPWVVRVFKEIEPAQHFLSELAGLGLDVYLLKQSGIRKLENKLAVKGARFGPDGIIFSVAGGQETAVRYAELFLIVRGRIELSPEREDQEENPTEVSLGGLIVGAAGEEEEDPEDPLVRLKQQARKIKVKPKPRHQRMSFRRQANEVMDIYLSTSRVGIRVIENEMDYSGLAERKRTSALLNFNLIFRELCDHAPEVKVDENFKKIGYVLEEVKEKDAVRSQLQELGLSSSAKILYDNRAFFTDYSSRLYLHYLRLAQKSKTPSEPEHSA